MAVDPANPLQRRVLMADDGSTDRISLTPSRRTLVKTGAKLGYSAPVIAATMKLGIGRAGAVSPVYTSWSTSLAGTDEVPPTASPATGSFSATLGSGQITYALTWSNLLEPVTAAHIHQAPAGVNGPIVIPLSVALGTTSGSTNETISVAQSLIDQISANPSGFYVNVHSSIFPGGEIRGQLGC
jgi:hypothetical protein